MPTTGTSGGSGGVKGTLLAARAFVARFAGFPGGIFFGIC